MFFPSLLKNLLYLHKSVSFVALYGKPTIAVHLWDLWYSSGGVNTSQCSLLRSYLAHYTGITAWHSKWGDDLSYGVRL